MPLLLPQYHETAINNAAWGAGFTDWVNVKKNMPLYDGHPVPDVPSDGYYDLSRQADWQVQVSKAQAYGIDGFIFYHYWFKNKPELHKPIKQFLASGTAMEFAFSWANETWARTWDGKDNEVILAQEYGGPNDWDKHFSYLLEFFNDPRYTKIENRPLLIIYDAKQLETQIPMLTYLVDKTKKAGFSGLHLIYTEGKKRVTLSNELDFFFHGKLLFEPLRSFSKIHENIFKKIYNNFRHRILRRPIRHDFNQICNSALRNLDRLSPGDIPCGHVEWDNSARKGHRSTILRFESIDQWLDYHRLFQEKVNSIGCHIVTFNAWNEWAEGATIDKSNRNSSNVLDAIKTWK